MRTKIILLVSFIFFAFYFTLFSSKQSEDEKLRFECPSVPEDEWFVWQRAFPFQDIPRDEWLNSMKYVKNNMTKGDGGFDANWTLAGPTNIEGRITTIAMHPTNPQIVYTGCAGGGVWKSTNFCQSWVSIFDNQNTSSIGALAIDPSNPQVIYCGTGESNALRSYYPGTGMYKSTDGGTTWNFIGLENTYCFGNIAINPLNTQEVYAAAVGSLRHNNPERGLYKTTNGGLNWTLSLFLSDSVGAVDVVLDPVTPSRVFAAMWERTRRENYIKYGGPMTAMYKSTNAGVNWFVVAGGFPSNDPNLGRITLDIAKSNPQVLYAFTAYTNGNSRGLYKSTDGGNNWSLINSSVGSSSNYAWFNRPCRVNPTDPDNLYCGGLYMEHSLNGGTSFSTGGAYHVDQHAIAFAPSNTNMVIIGNDGGIDYSSNGGSSWLQSTTLPITQFYAGDIDYNNPNVILGGAQDNGTLRTLTGNLGDWTDITGGDGFYCLVDYTNSQRVYASTQNGGIVRSTNGGISFMSGTSGLDLTYTNWMTPFVMDKNTPLTLYCGTYKIHKTTNAMQSWTPISGDLTNGHIQNLGTITTVDVSKLNPNVIYCGTDDANVWVTTNAGNNWTNVKTGLPYRWVTRVTIHPDSANICYVTLSGYKVDSAGAHVYRTTNYGSSWTSIKGNLPDAPINDVIIDPADYNTLYIGTDIAVMYTTNLGSTWQVLGSGFPTNVPCHDLTFHAPTRTLVVWTHGRSAFKIIVPPLGITNNHNEIPERFILFQNYPNPFNPGTVIKYSISGSTDRYVKLTVYDLLGKVISKPVDKEQKPGNYAISFEGSNISSGVYFYKLEVSQTGSSNLPGYTDVKKMILLK